MALTHGPLSQTDLFPDGALRRLGRCVIVHETIDSTNKLLLEQGYAAGDGAVAYAELQTAGRGRLGRRWDAPRGSSVLLSVLLLEPPNTALQSHGALLGTVAACESIEAQTDVQPTIRWPNDLVHNGRKLGGVLAESCSAMGTPTDEAHVPPGATRAVVIGVGINCYQQRTHFRGDLFDKATSLDCETERPVHRAPIAARLLQRLDHWLTHTREQPDGWEALRIAWRQRCADLGRRLVLEHDGRQWAGTVLDISEEGDLIVQLDQGGRRHFAAATTTRVW